MPKRYPLIWGNGPDTLPEQTGAALQIGVARPST